MKGWKLPTLSGLFKKAAVFTMVALPFALDLEWNGYDLLDRKDGGNVLADIDPWCRHLTPGEIELARGVFGDIIDYGNVKVFDRPYLFFTGGHCSGMAPNGNIYIAHRAGRSADYSAEDAYAKSFFLHEMTHVVQYKTGRDVRLEAGRELIARNFDYSDAYPYNIDDDTAFAHLRLEQQAEAVSDYYLLREFMDEKGAEDRKYGWDRANWNAAQWRLWSEFSHAHQRAVWRGGVTEEQRQNWDAGAWRDWMGGQEAKLARYEKTLAPVLVARAPADAPTAAPVPVPAAPLPPTLLAGPAR